MDKVRANTRREDPVGADVFQFESQGLVESHGGEFAGAVVDQLGDARVACQTGDGDDVAVVVLQHLREEGLCGLRRIITMKLWELKRLKRGSPSEKRRRKLTQKWEMVLTLNDLSIISSGVSSRARPEATPALLISKVT